MLLNFSTYIIHLSNNTDAHVWDYENPTIIPIPTLKRRCEIICHNFELTPLKLSFCCMIRTFQGLETKKLLQ